MWSSIKRMFKAALYAIPMLAAIRSSAQAQDFPTRSDARFP